MGGKFHLISRSFVYGLAVMIICGGFCSQAEAVKITPYSKYESKVAECNKALIDLYDAVDGLRWHADALIKHGEKGVEGAKQNDLKGFKFGKDDSKNWREKKDVLKKSIKNYQKKCQGITNILKGGVSIE